MDITASRIMESYNFIDILEAMNLRNYNTFIIYLLLLGNGYSQSYLDKIPAFINNLERTYYQFADFDEDWNVYHKKTIEKVVIYHKLINSDEDSHKELFIFTEVHPELIAGKYYDAHIGYIELSIADFKNNRWQIVYKNVLRDFSMYRHENIYITDYDNDKKHEINLLTRRYATTAGVARNFLLFKVQNNKLIKSWEYPDSYNYMFVKEAEKEMVIFNWIWPKGQGRGAPGNYNVLIYNYNHGEFTKSQEYLTRSKFDPFNADYNLIYNHALYPDIFTPLNYPKYTLNSKEYKYEYRFGSSGAYGYNYDIEGENEDGNYVEGNVSIDSENNGWGYILNDNGDEVEVECRWYDYGQIEAQDEDGNLYYIRAK